MGVRIAMYAVDVPRFMAFVEQPIGALLSYYLDHGSASEFGMHCFQDVARELRYMAVPGRPLRCFRGPTAIPVEVTPEQMAADPFLSRKTADYLREENSLTLRIVLRGLGECPSC